MRLVLIAFAVAVGTLSAQTPNPTHARAAAAPDAASAPASTATGVAKDLPVRKVVLYKNGIGYFEHAGTVNGNQRVSIDFTSPQLNDVLQSLTVLDEGGGRIGGVNYNSTTPLAEQLKALSLGMSDDPTSTELFQALRGQRVEVLGAPGGVLQGRLMSIESRDEKVGGSSSDATVTKFYLTLVAGSGAVRVVELTPALSVRPLDANLQGQLDRYLELLSTTHANGLRHLTLNALGAGARQVECTLNGIGERAGNAALEEVVMAIKTRNDVLPYMTGVDAAMLTRASKLVSAATSFPVQYNKAIVGRNAFAHESGIHQDGMLKNAQTYEIMTPATVGVKQTSLVMGKHSGRHAFVHKLEELGYELASNQLEDAFVRFKALADRKKQILEEDIEALVDEEIATAHDRIKVLSLTVIAGTMGPQTATLTLDIEGQHVTTQSTGNGPVDAIFNAIHALVPHEAKLELYQVHAVTEGTDAQAEVSVRLSENGRSFTAKAADPDTLVASAKAYVGALNKLTSKRGKTAGVERRIHSQDVG